MKKTEIKKLRLHRETLFALAIPEAQKIVGGWGAPYDSFPSSQSNGGACCEATLTFTRE